MRYFVVLAVVLAAALAPQCASAQSAAEPTPQDAQKFVQIILNQGATRAVFSDLQFDKIMDDGWNCGGNYVCSVTFDKTGTLYWVGSADVCSTTLSVAVDETSWRFDHATFQMRETPSTTLSWKAISATVRSGNTVTLSGSSRIRTFYFATEDVAVRVQKAFDLLIRTCDPTRGMGF